jgi:predicted MFS family arabinose efflux permease
MNGLGTRLLPYSLAFFSSLCIMILELVAGRLVARHVGSSLVVWNSVIGIMLGGICLGNVLGGRLADRVEPSRAVGPLYALGAALTLGCLWVNSLGALIPDYPAIPWIKTIAVVCLDFLIPGTLLGMIGPVVAKMAIEQAKKTGSAIGDVYFLGAVGSIVGTFIAGFVLLYYAPVSVIVTIVAAALALLAGLLMKDVVGLTLGTTAAIVLGVGSGLEVYKPDMVGGIEVGGVPINYVMLVGHIFALILAFLGIVRLFQARSASIADEPKEMPSSPGEIQKTSLADLAVLSFIVSMAFMAFEMAASRFVTHHLGSSIYGWTSVIGVLLGGLAIGNFLGGVIANHIKSEKGASWLFLLASMAVLSVLLLESPPKWLCTNPIGWIFKKQEAERIFPGGSSILTMPVYHMTSLSWWARVLIVVTATFFLPSLTLGTVSPVVAKLAVDRLRASKRTGTAIGQVYAWGMVGSILGTFLTGFFLIDVLGTKGVILLISVLLALSATMLGSIWHAAWAGVPLGLCVIAFLPIAAFERRGIDWGIREERGDPTTEKAQDAWVDESNYYFIKVGNQPVALGQKRTIVLDNLEHGYFTLGHPEQLDYEYEHIYALVADRVARARAKEKKTDKLEDLGVKTLFFGGGAYTFPRYLQSKYTGTLADVAEIDPAILKANRKALGLGSVPSDNDITTHLGDARAFVDRNQANQYDLVFGDAFNDFSVPWHLTTKEFNDKVSKMIGDKGVYMINIIDVYESEAKTQEKIDAKIKALTNPTDAQKARIERIERRRADRLCGFLGAWAETARKTFKHVYIYGTSETPGNGQRETFVVVVSNSPIDIEGLGSRDNDPQFFSKASDKLFEPKPFSKEHQEAVAKHSRGIILSDDYAPVENLLAPVAETRGHDD